MFKTFKEAQAFHKNLGIDPGDPLSMPIEQAREKQNIYFDSLRGVLPSISKIVDLDVQGKEGPIAIRLTYPLGAAPFNYVIFIRGAGWWAGGLDSHAQTTTSLADLSSCVVCAIDYYKTPEYCYPTQVNQIIEVLSFLRAHQAQFELLGNPILFGESAGSTIALSVAQKLRDMKEDALNGLVLFYCNADGFKPTARKYSQWVWEQYVGKGRPLSDNGAVPLHEDLSNLPPVFLAVGEDDPLMGDTQKLFNQLISVGANPELHVFAQLPHGFLMWTATLEPALKALEKSAHSIKNCFKERA
ncbi:MAG: alpha/beta hydrolase fold domain-containing protein [Betaproteobacteria bacterium]|jgi:acetyl esterase